MKKLRDRTDEAGIMTRQSVEALIAKTFDMRKKRDEFVRQKKEKLLKVTHEFDKKINWIEREMYKLENAAKLMAGATEYYYLKAQLKPKSEKPVQKKQEELPKEEPQNGQVEMQ